MGKNTFLKIAKKVLEEKKVPLSYMEILEYAEKMGYDRELDISKNKSSTMIEELYKDVNDNSNSIFKKIGSKPTRFILKEILSEYLTDISFFKENRINISEIPEKKLYSYTVYFSNKKWDLKCKTVLYGKSTARKYSKWLHPNIIGIKFTDKNYDKGLSIDTLIREQKIKLYSFEITKSLTYDNMREKYFNSMSTSSWANEAYLVVANLDLNDDNVMRDLQKLNSKFGNGIINININNPDSSDITFPALHKDDVDWDKIKILSNQNSDFKNLIMKLENNSAKDMYDSNFYDTILRRGDL